MYAGDEHLSDTQQNPELADWHGSDPLDYECLVCGANPGEQCRPDCITDCQ